MLEGQMGSIQSSLDQLYELIKSNSPKKKAETKEKPKSWASEAEEEDELEQDEEDDSDDLVNPMAPIQSLSKIHNLKVDFKVDMPMYDGTVDVDKLDDWIERLETYFTVYDYKSSQKITVAVLKLSKDALTWWKAFRRQRHQKGSLSWREFKAAIRKKFYPVGYLEERWFKWYRLIQSYNQSVQDYTSEFSNQGMALDVDLDEYTIYMKYVSGLHEYIRKELKMFSVKSITEASIKASAIEGRLKKHETKGSKGKFGTTSSKDEVKDIGQSKSKEGLVCIHCKQSGHLVDKCWDKSPELKPQNLQKKDAKKSLAASRSTELPGLTEPNKKINVMC